MERRPLAFIVVAEAPADAQIACDLADRVFVEDEKSPDWLEEYLLNHLHSWSGFEEGTLFTRWTTIKRLARQRGIQYIGHIGEGRPGSIDFAQARKAIIMAQRISNGRPIRAVVLIRDLDDQQERRDGLEQAKAMIDQRVHQVVIGAVNPKREAWVLNGFVPETREEEKALAALRGELSFDPCERAERLTAKKDTAKRNAKRVLKVLTRDSREREPRCWKQTSLDLLKQRGEKTGLRDYLVEVETRLLPLLEG